MNIGVNGVMGERGRFIGFADYLSQGGNRQLLAGALLGLEINQFDHEETPVFYIGSFIRWGDALIPVVKMDFNSMTIGISYDVNISKLNVVSNWRGGLELTATYRGFLKIRNSTLDRVRCVRF